MKLDLIKNLYCLASMIVVHTEGPPVLCRTDQVGEICVTSGATGSGYFGLAGLTNATFRVQALQELPEVVGEGVVSTPKVSLDEIVLKILLNTFSFY